MKKYIIITLLALVTCGVNAQDGSMVFLNYLPSVPLGKTADYVSNTSPRGLDFEVQKFLKDDVSVGFVVGWHMFRDKLSDITFDYEDLTVTGTQFRYLNVVPMDVNIKKYFVNEGLTMPYVGFGLGTSYNDMQTEAGVFVKSEDKWLFHIAPEVGMLYDLNYTTFLSVKLKYNYSPDAGGFPGSTSFISLGVGVGLK